MPDHRDWYTLTYGNFVHPVLAQVRREVYDHDIGQNSWLMAEEFEQYISWLELTPASQVLDVASGSGGPALFLGRRVGCQVTGVDINQGGLAAANELAHTLELDTLVRFHYADATHPLPFEDQAFTAVLCIDGINHLPGRLQVLKEWHRILCPGGRLLFSNPITVTGILSHEEIAIRSSIGYFLFTPPGEDEHLLQEAGFQLIGKHDTADNYALTGKRHYEARARHREQLLPIEGEAQFEGTQRFLSVAHTLASERRLSRFVFVAQK